MQIQPFKFHHTDFYCSGFFICISSFLSSKFHRAYSIKSIRLCEYWFYLAVTIAQMLSYRFYYTDSIIRISLFGFNREDSSICISSYSLNHLHSFFLIPFCLFNCIHSILKTKEKKLDKKRQKLCKLAHRFHIYTRITVGIKGILT